MTEFVHGLNARLVLGGVDVSPFFRSASVETSKDVVETTAFGSTSKSYIPGLRDATASLEGMFESAISDEHLRGILESSVDTHYTMYPEGDDLSKFGFAMAGIQTTYAVSASTDDVVQASAEIQSVVGAERVQCLLPLEEVASTGTGTSVDGSSSSSEGGVGYLQVADAGTSVTVLIQHSTDGTTWTDLITFDAATGAGSQRKSVTGTVNRYTRASYTVTGGPATFQVSVGRQLPIIP